MTFFILYLILTITLYGFFLPTMISAKSSLSVIAGCLVVIGHFAISIAILKKRGWKMRRMFNNITKYLGMFAIIMLVTLTACQKVPAGYKGVKVYLLGTDKGVNSEELGVGRYWIGINEELYLFPTFTQNYVWTSDKQEGSENNESITFQTKEGLDVNADIGISYQINPAKVSDVFEKYRKGIGEITDIYLRNMVRDAFNAAASTKKVEYVYGEGKRQLLSEVIKMVREEVTPIGIDVEKIYLVGKFRLPDTVVKALNAKIEATQRAQQRENEVREAEAQAEKQIAEARGKAESMLKLAKAEAEAMRIKKEQISPQLIQYETVIKWDGQLPQVTSGAVPLLNIGK